MSKRKKILLIGTSFSAAPLLHALRAMGHEVAVCGNIPNDPCVSWADEYFEIDYSDSQALAALVEAESFAALCPSCNDLGYLAAAAVAEQHGYAGFDSPFVTRLLHDKACFREIATEIGIRVPQAWTKLHEMNVNAICPVLVKPTDSFSGRGMVKVERATELEEALRVARAESRSGSVLMEEFIDGTLHSHSAFLYKQSIASDYFVDEFCTIYPYQVNCSNSPSSLHATHREEMRGFVKNIAKHLKLTDGLLHTQFLLSGNKVYVLECMRRCPGDLFYHLVSYSTGANYIDDYLRPFLGGAPKAVQGTGETPWARHTVSLAHAAVVWSIEPCVEAEALRVFPLRECGAHIAAAPFDKLAILFARFAGTAQMHEVTPRLASLIQVNAEGVRDDHTR